MNAFRQTPRETQIAQLRRRFGLPRHRAQLLAELHYGEASA
jgi:hypothetical protein